MKNQSFKFLTYLIVSVVLTLGLSLSFQSLLAAWQAPTSAPPDGNVNPPIYNESGTPDVALVTIPFGLLDRFTVGGDSLYVDEVSGKVGIGTANPQRRLHVQGDSLNVNYSNSVNLGADTVMEDNTVSMSFIAARDSTLSSTIKMNEVNTSGDFLNGWAVWRQSTNTVLPNTGNGSFHIAYSDDSNVGFETKDSSTQKFTILPNGNVGIGEKDPEAKLHVGGVAGVDGIMFPDGTLQTTAGGGGTVNHGGQGQFAYYEIGGQAVSGTSSIYIAPDGKVGIGMTSPKSKLHILGKDPINVNYESWTYAGTRELQGNLTLTNKDPVISLIGLDETATVSSLKMIEVDDAGDFNNIWAIYRSASTYEDGGLHFGYSDRRPYWWGPETKFSILPNGNVGIGEKDPEAKLHVGGVAGVDGIMFPDGTLQTTAGGGGTVNPAAQGQLAYYETGGQAVSGTSSIYISSDGNVGIGTNDPNHILHVVKADNSVDYASNFANLRADIVLENNNPILELIGLQDSTSLAAIRLSEVAKNTGDFVSTWTIWRNTTPNGDADGDGALHIAFIRQGDLNGGGKNADYNDIWNGSAYENRVFTIKPDGNVGIGEYNPAYRLEIGGGDVNTTGGGYRDAGSCVAGTCASDLKLKNNINPISGALDKIGSLNPVSFEFIDPAYGPGIQYGLIAQDVEKIFPEMVTTGEDGFLKIKYGLELQMQVIQAVKELKKEKDAEIERLRNEIEMLKLIICIDHPKAEICEKE